MLEYAQADTHYLLYVYDRLRADLFDAANGQSNLIQLVWSKSKDLCLKVPYSRLQLRLDYIYMDKCETSIPFFNNGFNDR